MPWFTSPTKQKLKEKRLHQKAAVLIILRLIHFSKPINEKEKGGGRE